MENTGLPPGAVPVEQFESASTPPVPQMHPVTSTAAPSGLPEGAVPQDEFQSHEEKYGGTGQQIIAGLEGVGKGVAGPIAPYLEKKFGVKPEDIRGRQEANPITHGVGEAVGLGAGMLTGTGEAALMAKAGHAATAALGLGKAAEGASLAYRVGSEAVKQAAEMAVMQGSDEVAKMILQDPEQSAQTALANIGLSTALGGAGGAFVTGVMSPLWKATIGGPVDDLLSKVSNRLGGDGGVVLPEVVQKSLEDLNVQLAPELRAALGGDKSALGHAQELYRAQNPKFLESLKAVPEGLQQAVSKSLGVPLEELTHFSNAESGRAAHDLFVRQVKEELGPIAARLDARNAEAAKIMVPDEARISLSDKIIEAGMSQDGPGLHAPSFKQFEHYAQRILAEDSVKGIDRLRTELSRNWSHAANENDKLAWSKIRGILGDFREQEITKQGKALGPEGEKLAAEMLGEHTSANKGYAQYAEKMNDIMQDMSVGKFKGTESLLQKLESISPEALLKKFQAKGDVQAAEFLAKNFPQVAKLVKEHETKQFLAKSIKTDAGESVLDLKGLSKRVENLMKGEPEYAKYVLPEGAQQKIESARIVQDAISNITSIKDSGTPAGMGKVFKHMGGSALAAVSWMTGHNPLSGALVGETATRLGKDAPEAIKLAWLRFLGAEEAPKAEGFKAMVDFIHNTIKGESAAAKASKAVFTPGVRVLQENAMPFKDREKLDKIVTKLKDEPDMTMRLANGQTGYYLPGHQTALTASAVGAVQYLQGLKPEPYKPGPLDKEIPPSSEQKARYNRALDIANQPAMVLQHIKEGTLVPSDIADLQALYPKYYSSLSSKLTNDMVAAQAKGEVIPYRTRVGLSLFLGQPVDSTMTPGAIQAAQPQPKEALPMAQGGKKGSLNKLGKSNHMYQTPDQAAQQDRNKRD